jgi:hypothetical protein
MLKGIGQICLVVAAGSGLNWFGTYRYFYPLDEHISLPLDRPISRSFPARRNYPGSTSLYYYDNSGKQTPIECQAARLLGIRISISSDPSKKSWQSFDNLTCKDNTVAQIVIPQAQGENFYLDIDRNPSTSYSSSISAVNIRPSTMGGFFYEINLFYLNGLGLISVFFAFIGLTCLSIDYHKSR